MFPIASNSDDPFAYVDDVFSTYLYTGNGATQTINNGIDLAGKGGMVWQRSRTSAQDNHLWDTARGANYDLVSNTTASQYNRGGTNGVTSFNSNGFTITGAQGDFNASSDKYASWTFRKAAKFFDVVTWTSTNSSTQRTISHNLGITPGMVIIKSINTNTNSYNEWYVAHRYNLTAQGYLNQTYAFAAGVPIITAWTDTTVTFAANFNEGVSNSYIVYLFAHDTSSTGIIQCGSYTGNGNAITGPVINLGWEPQWVMLKNATTGALYYDWYIMDDARGIGTNYSDQKGGGNLNANTTDPQEVSFNPIQVTPTGFKVITTDVVANKLGDTFIYMAIRRPNKPPTTGTQVFNSVPRTGTGANLWVASGAGFPPDMTIMGDRSGILGVSYAHAVIDRVRRATEHIQFASASAEGGGWGYGHMHNMNGYDGLYAGDAGYYNHSTSLYVDYHFKRAPGFFDVVCYTGTGVARTVAHNLTVAPELMILKSRIGSTGWVVYDAYANLSNTYELLVLNTTGARGFNSLAVNSTVPTSSVFTVGPSGFGVNNTSETYVAYLFATLAGISKVGSYTGNGSSQNIQCGFATGARFVLIKRTDSTGDWYVWDTARGIVTGNDPHLSLNAPEAEVTTDDSIDPYSPGFTVNQVAATNINVTTAIYIFLAIA